MLVSGSDDFTLFLWKPGSEKTPVARMTGWNRTAFNYAHIKLSKYSNVLISNYAGHQQLVNDVKFSPDARLVASASFDKSIRVRNDSMDLIFLTSHFVLKVWCGKTGRFLMTLRGHVQAVYQVHIYPNKAIYKS